MATTITRSHWVNDSGTPGAPVGDGTQINESELQKIYNNIDSLIANNISFGGTVSAEGFGTHVFSASGTGGNTVRLANTLAGTGNYAQFQIDNNTANVGVLIGTSTTYTPSGDLLASCLAIRGVQAGGVSVAATNAAGDLRFYMHGATSPNVVFGAVPSGFQSAGLTNVLSSNLGLLLGNTSIFIEMQETGAAVDNKRWQFSLFSSNLHLTLFKDDASASQHVWRVTRSGMTVASMTFWTDLLPATDNTWKCGLAANRWSEVNAVIGNFGDIAFENDWAWTEAYKIGDLLDGVALVNPRGEVVALFDARGLHVREAHTDLDDYAWRVTTKEERASHGKPH